MRPFIMIVCAAAFGIAAKAAGAAGDAESLQSLFLRGEYRGCAGQGLSALTPESRMPDKDELYYITGLSCLKSGDYAGAEKMFSGLLREFRRSRFADEARVGLADSLYLKGDLRGARAKYEDFLETRLSSKLRPGVYYRLALAADRMGDSAAGRRYRELLKKEFPRSPEAAMDKDIFPARQVSEVEYVLMEAPEGKRLAGSLYYIQVGAFSRKSNAERLAGKLAAQGYPVYVDQALSKGDVIYKVKAGRFDNFPEAKALERRLARDGYPTKLDR